VKRTHTRPALQNIIQVVPQSIFVLRSKMCDVRGCNGLIHAWPYCTLGNLYPFLLIVVPLFQPCKGGLWKAHMQETLFGEAMNELRRYNAKEKRILKNKLEISLWEFTDLNKNDTCGCTKLRPRRCLYHSLLANSVKRINISPQIVCWSISSLIVFSTKVR
jgi:hypothetical protein